VTIQQIKKALRQAAALAYYVADSPPEYLKGKVVLLMYHRVLTEKDLERYYVQPGMYVRNDVFEQQMSYLRNNFRILPLSYLVDMWKDGVWDDSQRYCVITFDDGWLDNYRHAYPILLKYNIPATIFLPTSLIDTNHWFWPDSLGYIVRKCFSCPEEKSISLLYEKWPWMKSNKVKNIDDKIDSIIESVKAWPDEEINRLIENITDMTDVTFPDERMLLNWQEVEEMSKSNISFGSHSASHAILTKLSIEKVRIEMQASLKTLREKNINHLPIFCYPNGNYTEEIAELAKSAGYSAAVTTRFGVENSAPQKMFELKRIGIHNDISNTAPLFTFHLSGLNNMLREALK
jgi:peptidoglycan/xylan/chitin deacetylase (PgdA/CDA1 family)